MNHRYTEEREETQTKGIDNLFNNRVIESIPVSRNGGASICRRLSEHQTSIIRKEIPPDIYN
jgi:hypothetical protein